MTGTSNAIDQNTNQFLKLAGGTMAGAIAMGSHQITGMTDPSLAQDAATKFYVDSVAQGLNPKPASAAASTTALTVTYNNGSSGIGATLTNATTQAAFAIDGYTAALGDVILIKDQASTLQNGLYTLTTVGSGASNWILTRSVYMDAPAEFLGGYTFVINGTTNAGRSYVETATVSAVGTDAVTFVQFSQSKQLVVAVQTFTAGSSTYTPSTGLVYCIVEIVGGGASGGGVSGGTAGQCAGAGGGGGGGYCRRAYSAALIGASATVVVGTGGAAATAGANNGSVGISSTFSPAGGGTVLTAGNGVGGTAMSKSASAQAVAGGVGGTATGGQLNIPGQPGGNGNTQAAATLAIGGQGGGSFFSTSTGWQVQTLAGNNNAAPTSFGGGSSGAVDLATANTASIAAANGTCFITEFCLV